MKPQGSKWNLFKINKGTRTTSLTLLFVFIVYFEQISHISVVSIVDFEQVNTGNFQKWAEKTNPGKTNIEGGGGGNCLKREDLDSLGI